MKRTLSILLAMLMVFGVFSGLSISAAETDTAATGASYDLWLGETQVTDANKNDILNDGGKAKFDPETNTLMLKEPTIPGVYVRTVTFDDSSWTESSKICSLNMYLTVKGSYHMTEAEAEYGICNTIDYTGVSLYDTGMMLDGDFTFYSTYTGIYSNYDLTLNGDITAEGKWFGIDTTNGNVNINGGNIKACGTGSDSYGIMSTLSVNISGNTKSVIAQATNHSGIMTHVGLNINNTGDQNVQIIEPADAVVKTSISDSYYQAVFEADGETEAKRVVIKSETAPVTYILGDSDGDEDVSSVDVTLIQRYCADFNINIPEETLMHGDVDGSGDLDILDATLIQRFLADFNVQYPIGQWV